MQQRLELPTRGSRTLKQLGWRSALWGVGLVTILPGCATSRPGIPVPPEPRATAYHPSAKVALPPTTPTAKHPPSVRIERDTAPLAAVPASSEIQQVAATTQAPPPPILPPPTADDPRSKAPFKLEVPPALPGAEATLSKLPPDTPATRADRLRQIDALFPKLPDLGPDPMPALQAGDTAVTIDAMIEQGKRNSPVIQQAMAEIERNRGQWVQAGLYPNPTAGYQGDQIADAGTAGQQGAFFNQTIITAQKLKLASSVAYFDWINARLKLRRQEFDLARQVRADYYSAMVAAENVRITHMICEFTEEVYLRQVANVRGGQSAPFEANALRAVVGQSRTSLIQARNRYVSAWKQLAATLNDPDMRPAVLAAKIDGALPRFQYDSLQQRMLNTHTDLTVARNQVAQAQQSLTLERRRPIPDLQNNFYFQEDSQLNSFQLGVQLGVTVPLWNKNQGNIASAQASLVNQTREVDRVRNDLVRKLAENFERYETGRQQLNQYRELILPDLVRAFRGVFERYQVEPQNVNYNDIVTAQQNFSSQLLNYLQALQGQWQAIADLTAVVQVEDPFVLSEGLDPALPDSWPLDFKAK